MNHNGYPTDLRVAGRNSDVVVKNLQGHPTRLLNPMGKTIATWKRENGVIWMEVSMINYCKSREKVEGCIADLKKLEFANKEELYLAANRYLHLPKVKVDPEVSGYDLEAQPQLKMAWLTLIENYGR